MSEPYLGEIRVVGFNFPPVGWLSCNGALVAISQYDALYALLGTTYGGDGQATFALPDLRGRVAVGQGTRPGGSSYALGQKAGQENVTLLSTQMPTHNHALFGALVRAETNVPSGNLFGRLPGGGLSYLDTSGVGANPVTDVALAADAVTGTGGNQPHSNIMPILALNHIICVEGIFPGQA